MRKKATRSGAPAGAPAKGPTGDDVEVLDLNSVGDLLDELGETEDTKISIWRAPDRDNPREQFLDTVSASGLTLDDLLVMLRDDHGGGTFIVRGRRGTQFIGGRRTISVVKSRKDPAAAAAAPTPSINMFEMWQASEKRNADLLTAILAGNKGSALGFSDVLSAAKILSGHNAAPPNTLGQLKELLEIKDLLAGDAPRAASSEGGPSWLEIAKTAAEFLSKAASQAPAAAPGAAPAAIEAPAPSAPVPASAPMLQLLDRLMRGARRDSDPESYAIVVLDEIGDEAAAELLKNDGLLEMFEQLVQLHAPASLPMFQEKKTWFSEFIAAAREQLQPEEAPAPGG